MGSIKAARPFGGDEDANRAVMEALADGFAYATRRKRFIGINWRNMNAEAEERAAVEALSGEIDSRASSANVDPAAFRDALQTILQARHGRSLTIAPLPRRTARDDDRSRALDVAAFTANEVLEKARIVVERRKRMLEQAHADLRKALIASDDADRARDRHRAASAGA